MLTVYLILIGLAVFVTAAFISGVWLRGHRTKENAEKASRIMHLLFFAGLVAPALLGIFYPGLRHFDALLGLPSPPWSPVFLLTGIALAIPGLYFMASSLKLLRVLGEGANAFRLTKQVVAADLYTRTRNPMSLGFYLCALAVACISGSTFVWLLTLLGIIPAHLFFLKYFEELELALRFGAPYLDYRQRVPFLIPRLRASR